METLLNLNKPLEILKNALLDSCPGNHFEVFAKWFVDLNQHLLANQSDMANISYLKDACAKEMHDAIHARRDVREISNIASVYSYAINELRNLPPSDYKMLSPDWSSRFYDSAKESSDEMIQTLWGKILAGEIANNGKFYKRTLSVLKNMEVPEAKLFVKLVSLLISKEMVPEFIFQENEFFQYNDLQTLMDCGIVNSSDGLYTYENLKKLELSGYELYAINNDIEKVSLEGFALTDSGMQLCQLVNCDGVDVKYVALLTDRLSRSIGKQIEYRRKLI